uniref:Uncharacterized protein n=1 Tax=Vespula pensylvanica TaxID=30213 RepID=A0A834PBD5_VESPE|nr:hypothetical protein H0235_003162 [Vespula pensylvanica]
MFNAGSPIQQHEGYNGMKALNNEEIYWNMKYIGIQQTLIISYYQIIDTQNKFNKKLKQIYKKQVIGRNTVKVVTIYRLFKRTGLIKNREMLKWRKVFLWDVVQFACHSGLNINYAIKALTLCEFLFWGIKESHSAPNRVNMEGG